MNLLLIWVLLYGFVGTQLAWTLRPFHGDPSMPFILFRPVESNFYIGVIADDRAAVSVDDLLRLQIRQMLQNWRTVKILQSTIRRIAVLSAQLNHLLGLGAVGLVALGAVLLLLRFSGRAGPGRGRLLLGYPPELFPAQHLTRGGALAALAATQSRLASIRAAGAAAERPVDLAVRLSE